MKKKKQKQITTAADIAVALAGGLEPAIHSDREFFDHLIELIPVRFYVPNDDDEKPWYQGLTKAAKASLRRQTKENLKLARRNRFDPDANPTSAFKVQEPVDEEPVGEEDNKEKSITYEELREKLRRRIEAARGNRGESKRHEKRGDSEGYKRRREEWEAAEARENGGNVAANNDDDDDDGEAIIEYGKVRLGNEDDGNVTHEKKKRKLSKARELEIAKKKQVEKKENPSVAERESWKAAAIRATGHKVHDDPRLIKESMKKEKKRKEKNAEKWKDRKGSQQKMIAEKQKKRSDNISGRITEKKNRKIAKREKKLMRPGFEGRKEGFITKD